MGIYDRDYYRREGPSFLASLGDGGKVCIWLIAINAIVYIIQLVSRSSVTDSGYGPVTEWLDLDTSKVLHGQVWRLLTSAFLHDPNSLAHILFNMLFLWWFGHEVEGIYGAKEFLAFYLAAALCGSVAYVLWQLVTGAPNPALGASGAVTAVIVLFAMHYPHNRIMVFWFVPVSIWLFVVFMVAKDLFIFLNDPNPSVAVTAHLGGAAFGFLYYRRQWRMLNWVPDFSGVRRARARPKLRVYRGDDSAPAAEPMVAAPPESPVDEQLEAQLDAVLAKMNRTGKESLTESEREILMRAAEVYKPDVALMEKRMPLFEYECKKCDHTFEALVFNGEAVECPQCQGSKVERLLSVIAKPRESTSPSSCSPSAPPCSPRCCRLPPS